jgi:hypothetical protein
MPRRRERLTALAGVSREWSGQAGTRGLTPTDTPGHGPALDAVGYADLIQ